MRTYRVASGVIPAHTFLGLPPDRVTPAAEEEFFTSLRMRNGTYKTTSWRRFSAVDEELRGLALAGRLRVDHVLDVGVSAGASTLELYDALAASGRPVRIVATDLMTAARLVRVFPGCFTLTDDTGFPLRHDLGGWTLKPWVVGGDYRNGFFILRKAINVVFTRRARGLLRRRDASIRVKRVDLVTPRLRACAGIAVENDDINTFNPVFAGRFDFIRAANILNRSYFTERQLRAAVGNLRQYLAVGSGSMVLVIRTHQDRTNHGTLFTMGPAGGCEVACRFGGGSEIEDLVLDVMRAPQRAGKRVEE